jgi:protein-tyrosine phosphatase
VSEPAPEIYTLDRPGPGRLSTAAHPWGGERLDGQLRGFRARGVDVVVCLLTDDELVELGLTREPETAAETGLAFVRMPVPDLRPPELGATRALAGSLAARLSAGDHVVVHCRAGIGRSSTVAGAVLVHEGWSAGDAWELISRARGAAVPETAEQRALLDQLADSR